jgi:Protein of unknown function (DUF3313)
MSHLSSQFTARCATVGLLFALAGCASVDTMRGSQIPADLPMVADASDRDVMTWRADAAFPRSYVLDPFVWSGDTLRRTTSKDRAQLGRSLDSAIQTAMTGYERSATAAAGVAVVRVSIEAIDKSSPAANAALALLVGPVDTGGASVSIRIDDGAGGTPLAALATSYNGSVLSTKGFKRWGHAEQAFERTGKRLSALLAGADAPSSGMR